MVQGAYEQWYRKVTQWYRAVTDREADSGTRLTQASRSRTDRPVLAAPAWAL